MGEMKVGDKVCYRATVQIINPRRATVALFDHNGEWCGASRVDSRGDLIADAKRAARQMAAVKGGQLLAVRRHV